MAASSCITDGLNEEQFAAVTAAPDRHYLVLAGAGCGKTTVLTRRIAYLNNQGIALSSILALTFTRKAADEMGERLLLLVPINRDKKGAVVTTFHAFALSVLSAEFEGVVNFNRLGFEGNPTLLDERKRLEMLSQLSTSNQRVRSGFDLLRLDSFIEKMSVFPDSVRYPTEDAKMQIEAIATRLHSQKRECGLWDFSDLISGVVTLFSEYTHICDYYRKFFSIILVDEFQDTNPLQIKLLTMLLGSDRHLFAVGDDDQAIYAFRGADIRPTTDFCNYFPGAAILKLQTNYRSVPSILKRANTIFRGKDPLYRKVLRSGKYHGNSGARPEVHIFKTEEQLAGWIAEKMAQIERTATISPTAMAILCRNNQSVEWMQSYFSKTIARTERMPQFLTVHKSKGLEFPVVFVCDMEESVFPSYRQVHKKRLRSFADVIAYLLSQRKCQDVDIAEELRLFYVAVTRAQQHLYLLHTETKIIYDRRHHFVKSRFLRYMT